MHEKPKAILFDMDGVLVDSYLVWFHLLNAVARQFGYPAITDDAYRVGWGQSTSADRESFFPGHSVGQIEAAYDEHYHQQLEHLRVPDSVPGVFAHLEDVGLASTVCTNTQGSLARVTIARTGATPQAIVGGDEVPRGKPAPDMLLRACELLSVTTDDAWMVGDSRYDRQAAEAAGVHFVGRGIDGDQRIEELGELTSLL